MASTTLKVLQEALRLSPIQKAELIDELFHSFDRSIDRHIDEAWTDEVESRIDAYEAGKISADPAEAVLARINRK